MELTNDLNIEQKQVMTQTQIQSLELLSLCNIELHEFLQNEYFENPLLEHSGGSQAPGTCEEFHAWYRKHYQKFNEGYGDSDKNEERVRPEVSHEQTEEIRDYIKDQLDYKQYSAKEMKAIDYFIHCLDDCGYCGRAVEEAAAFAGISAGAAGRCLEDLRQLDPVGIFAEDLTQCLLRQLEAAGIEDETLTAMVENHLKDMSEGKISNITRALHISSAQARKYMSLIASLNPKPLQGFYRERSSYIIPDVLVMRRKDGWDIELNDKWMGDFHISDYYMKMMAETQDQEIFEYFKKKLERVRFIIRAVEQRRETMIKITEAVLGHQPGFFAGKEKLSPMTMTELSEVIGVHPSTISRAVKGKYLQYPYGTVLMKDLFSKPVTGEHTGGSYSADQIKGLLAELVREEDKKKPYSDAKLVILLLEKGVELSRRGVAKYREDLGIKGSFDRKEI